MTHFLRSQFILQSTVDCSTCLKVVKESIFKMKFLIVLFCALAPFVTSKSVPIMSRNLVKRQSAAMGIGGGSGTGGASGTAAAISPPGIGSTSGVSAGSVAGGGGGSIEFSGILGSGSSTFGAGIGGGLGTAVGVGSEAAASVTTAGTGMGAGGEVGAAGPLKLEAHPEANDLEAPAGANRNGRFLFGGVYPYGGYGYGGYGYGGYGYGGYGYGGYPYRSWVG